VPAAHQVGPAGLREQPIEPDVVIEADSHHETGGFQA